MKKSYIYASVTVVIWATLAPVVKLLLADIPSLEALAVSSAFAFVFLLIVNILSASFSNSRMARRWRRRYRKRPRESKILSVISVGL